MNQKFKFDLNKAKAIIKDETGETITLNGTAAEFDVDHQFIQRLNGGSSSKLISFINNFCSKYNLDIQDVVSIKED